MSSLILCQQTDSHRILSNVTNKGQLKVIIVCLSVCGANENKVSAISFLRERSLFMTVAGGGDSGFAFWTEKKTCVFPGWRKKLVQDVLIVQPSYIWRMTYSVLNEYTKVINHRLKVTASQKGWYIVSLLHSWNLVRMIRQND